MKDSQQKQYTVSACYDDKKYDEREFIDILLKNKDITHFETFPSLKGLTSDLDHMIYAQDEPFRSLSTFASWAVYKKAQEKNLTVIIDGQGPDECLGGYTTSFYPFLSELLKTAPQSYVKELLSISKFNSIPIIKLLGISISNLVLPQTFKQQLKQNKLTQEYHWIKDDYVKDHLNTKHLYTINFTSLNSFLMTLFQRTSIPNILHILDRNSMAHSIESRVPFLDYRLIEHSFSIDQSLKINNGWTKHILRHAMQPYLPKQIKNRKDKMGFVTPEDLWIKYNRTKFKELILNAPPPFINKPKLEKWIEKHLNTISFNDNRIWKLICFQKWVKLFNISF